MLKNLIKTENKTFSFNLNLDILNKCAFKYTKAFGLIFVIQKKDTNFFFKVPSEIFYEKISPNIITFSVDAEKNYPILVAFIGSINESIANDKQKFRRRLSLFGLGYKILRLKSGNFLRLKIGYSHLIRLRIPKAINKTIVFKRSMRLESQDKITLGNFALKVYTSRKADVYKGRGLSLFTFAKARKKKIVKKK